MTLAVVNEEDGFFTPELLTLLQDPGRVAELRRVHGKPDLASGLSARACTPHDLKLITDSNGREAARCATHTSEISTPMAGMHSTNRTLDRNRHSLTCFRVESPYQDA